MHEPELPLLPLVLDGVPLALRRALDQEGIPNCERTALPNGRFLLFDSRLAGRCVPVAGQVPIDVSSLRNAFAYDPFEALASQELTCSRWRVGGLTITRKVAGTDKRGLRRQLLEHLRAKVELAGGVWVRLASCPFPYRAACSFRIDYNLREADNAVDFAKVLNAASGHERAISHFLSERAVEVLAEQCSRFRGLDVGLLSGRQSRVPTLKENLEDIGRGLEQLQAVGFQPRGFASENVNGKELMPALELLGMSHHSSAALAWDEVPFLPAAGTLLEVPVHPIPLEMLFHATARHSTAHRLAAPWDRGTESAEADTGVIHPMDYFDQLLTTRCRAGEPVFLFGKSRGLGRHPQLFGNMLARTAEIPVLWRATLTGLADWWRARSETRIAVYRRDGRYVVVTEQKPRAYRMGIEYCRGPHVALMPMDSRVVEFSPEALAYENRKLPPAASPMRVDLRADIRGRARRIVEIDQEVECAARASTPDRWHHRVGLALRRWLR